MTVSYKNNTVYGKTSAWEKFHIISGKYVAIHGKTSYCSILQTYITD